MELDGCERCALVWFDASELERLPLRARPQPPAARLTPEQAQAQVGMRMAAATAQGEFADPLSEVDAVPVGGRWGLGARLRAAPWLSLGVGLLLLTIHLWGVFSTSSATVSGARSCYAGLAEDYAFDPADPLRHGGRTLLTSFFVSPYTRRAPTAIVLLVLAGYLLERRLGRLRFGGLLALGHGAALLAYGVAGLPRSAGLLGASAGVATLLGWGAVVLGRLWMNERRLQGRWWLGWHGAAGETGLLVALGFGVWFGFTAFATLLTPWEDLVTFGGGLEGRTRTTPAAFVGGLVGLLAGLTTLRRVGTGARPTPDAARSEG